ncbi:MAG: DUF6186 family protein [Actinomycetes bacterium]
MNGYVISAIGFAVVGTLAALLTAWSRNSAERGRSLPATFTNLVRAAAALPGGRVLLLASWCWVGWHFLAR